MESILLLILVALLVLMVFISGLAIYFFRFKKKLDLFFKSGEENLEKLLVGQVKELDKQKEEIQKIIEDVSRLNKISQKSFQKIGLVRFNPFKDVGGNQSFSVALLDFNNNGFVITSLYSREGNRVYAKPVNNGKSEFSLSEEEKEAISKAQMANR